MLVLLATVNHAQVPPGAAGGNPMMPQGFPTPEQMQAQMENMQKMGLMPDAQTMQQMQAQQPPAGARAQFSLYSFAAIQNHAARCTPRGNLHLFLRAIARHHPL